MAKDNRKDIRTSLKYQVIFGEKRETFTKFGQENFPIRGTKASMVRRKKVLQLYPRVHHQIENKNEFDFC